MALFGSDRPVMPSFRTAPEPSRSSYDDLNRLERNPERNTERRDEDRNQDRALSRQLDRPDEREGLRAQELVERLLERDGREVERSRDREPVAAAKPSQPRRSQEGTDPLIQGLFAKLPEPETEWPLAGRQKWLQTAANIFDLMYAPHQADAGELAIRVERNLA